MKWFGEHWGAPICDDTPSTFTPVGALCDYCQEPIVAGDAGVVVPVIGTAVKATVAYHYECHLRAIIGGLNHIRGNCTCHGGTEDPDPKWLTKRQAALAAISEWGKGHRGR